MRVARVRTGAGPRAAVLRKDFANTLGPWIVSPDELEPYRDGDRVVEGFELIELPPARTTRTRA